jgi:TIR domain-containing protein
VVAWDFFIAHAGADRKAAEELHTALEQRGLRSFVDVRNLRPGDPWQVELKRALSNSRVTVVLVSASSDDAYYQQEEVALAVELARSGTRAHRIVPVLLRDATPEHLPYGLARLNRLAEGEAGLARVAEELGALLHQQLPRPGTEALAHASELVDEVWSRAEPAYTEQAARLPDEFKMRYRLEDDDIVARVQGVEQQRITRAEFEQRLTPGQLDYVLVLEKAMEVNLALWKQKHPTRVLDPGDRKLADRAVQAMGEDLAGVLDSLERAGLWLDDHYEDVRDVVRTHSQRVD